MYRVDSFCQLENIVMYILTKSYRFGSSTNPNKRQHNSKHRYLRVLPNRRRKSGILHGLEYNSMRGLSNLRNPAYDLRVKHPARPAVEASINLRHDLRLRVPKSEQMGYKIIN